MTTDDHTAIQLEFIRKCLLFFWPDDPMTEDERDELFDEELPAFAESIIHLGGYNLDTQLAALTAERDALREQLFKATKDLKRMARHWRNYAAGDYCQTYNPEKGKGLEMAADGLEDYINDEIQGVQE